MGFVQRFLRNWISHPLTRGLDIDDPDTTELRRRIIRGKPFLRKIYEDWYSIIVDSVPVGGKPVLEIGSGAGFFDEFISDLIPSDMFFCTGIKLILDGHNLPFRENSLRGIVLNNVLHHLSRPRHFLSEVARCVEGGGVLVMNEPWITPWSSFVYKRFHNEIFDDASKNWEFPNDGPLSSANGALPWIMFQRDRVLFETEYPQWNINNIYLHSSFIYLLSGGVSLKGLIPSWTYGGWKLLEWMLRKHMKNIAMFAVITLENKKNN